MDQNIYEKALKLFGIKGVKFTTEELARELGTSKRTIYARFSTKDELIEKTIDFVFSEIMESDEQILGNNELGLQEKIKLYFENIPYTYNLGSIIRHMDDLQKHYPTLWNKVNAYLDTSLDKIIRLVEQGIKEGKLHKVDTKILRLILIEGLKNLLDYDYLAKNHISFSSGLKEMNSIILYGLITTEMT